MSYQIEITKIEIVQEDGKVEATIEAMDSTCATVAMAVGTNVEDWTKLSNAVTQALLLMQLKVPE